jgi:hypothetical protein
MFCSTHYAKMKVVLLKPFVISISLLEAAFCIKIPRIFAEQWRSRGADSFSLSAPKKQQNERALESLLAGEEFLCRRCRLSSIRACSERAGRTFKKVTWPCAPEWAIFQVEREPFVG